MHPSILVTGGAGYIGSHMVKMLAEHGAQVTVVDDLRTGHADAVVSGELVEADLQDKSALAKALHARHFDVVMHFAASCYVGESVAAPGRYYRNNVVGTLNLLDVMLDLGVRRLVFSSSCSTYGTPVSLPISEDHPQNPINPYGASKLMCERLMSDYGRAHGFTTISLRYFNAAGCDPKRELGERHDPETHLIPLVLREALRTRAGGRPQDTELKIFGDDFDTPDGTCIRDYVHVADLCNAHLLAMSRLFDHSSAAFEAFNLGSGRGHSVKEVIDTCRRVTLQPIEARIMPRRPGDPPRLVASSERARAILGWSPQFEQLSAIVQTAWDWMSRQDAK